MALNYYYHEGFDRYVDDAALRAAHPLAPSNIELSSDNAYGYGKSARNLQEAYYNNDWGNFTYTGLTNMTNGVIWYFSADMLLESGQTSGSYPHNSMFSHVGNLALEHQNVFIGYDEDGQVMTLITHMAGLDPGGVTPKDSVNVNLRDDAWHHYEIMYLLDSTGLGWVKVWLDRTLILETSGVDNVIFHTANCTWAGHQGTRVDNVFIAECTVGEADRPDNNVACYPLVISGDAGTNQMTPNNGGDHYVEIDETTGHDGDTSKLTAASAGLREEFTIDSLPPQAVGVLGITLGGVIQGLGTGVGFEMTGFLESAGDDDDLWTSSPIAGGGWGNTVVGFSALSPDTGVAWTPAEVNAMHVGVRT